MGEEGIIVPVQIKREMCRDNVGNFEANPRPGLFIDEECWGCGLYYLCSYIDKFGDGVHDIVQRNCPNLTVCYDCKVDDFTHVEGCVLITHQPVDAPSDCPDSPKEGEEINAEDGDVLCKNEGCDRGDIWKSGVYRGICPVCDGTGRIPKPSDSETATLESEVGA